MSEPTRLDPDRVEGAPHPRETQRLIGHDRAEAAFLEAFNSGRMHHAWLITGPRGVGKATLAYRLARFLIATPPEDGDAGLFGAPPPPETLNIAPDHPVSRRITAEAEPGLFVLRRAMDDKSREPKLKTVITVDEARKLRGFFGLSNTEGGRRVVIIDAADEMNVSTANAILKLLEEPPKDAVLLLVCHQPARLLPTIRSRCRTLRLGPLEAAQMAEALLATGAALPEDPAGLASLADGSVGEALRLLNLGGLESYATLVALLSRAPGLDRTALIALADSMTGRAKADRYALFLRQIDQLLARIARAGLQAGAATEGAAGEAALTARLCPDPYAARTWAELQQSLGARARHGQAVNLDPAALILDMVLKIDQTAAHLAAR